MWKTNDLSTNEDVILTTLRHKNLIFDAIEELKEGINALDNSLPLDMISINVKGASEKIGEILGVNVTEDVEVFVSYALIISGKSEAVIFVEEVIEPFDHATVADLRFVAFTEVSLTEI